MNNFQPGNLWIIRPSSNFSMAQLRITTKTISFDLAAASELHYPERVVMFATDECNDLIITPWSRECPVGIEHSFTFFNKDIKPVPKRIIIREKTFLPMLRRERGWDADKLQRTVAGIYEAKYNAIYFNLKFATTAAEKKNKKVFKLSDYPLYSDVARRMKPVLLGLPSSSMDSPNSQSDIIVM